MANYRRNWVEPLAGDGKDRSHVLKLPFWTLFLRLAQIFLAIVLLVLTAFTASKIGADASGFGLTWFSVCITIVYFVWMGVSVCAYPSAYLAFMHLPTELILNIFWLCSWALLASEAVSVTRLESYLGDDLALVPSAERAAFSCLKVSAALGALEWLLFIVSAFVVLFASMGSLVREFRSGSGSEAAAEGGQKPVELQNQAYGDRNGPQPGW